MILDALNPKLWVSGEQTSRSGLIVPLIKCRMEHYFNVQLNLLYNQPERVSPVFCVGFCCSSNEQMLPGKDKQVFKGAPSQY